MMMVITDQQGVAVINEADLFSSNEGYPPESATELRGNITIAKPMLAGETYHVKIHVWDKAKAGNELTAEVDIIVR